MSRSDTISSSCIPITTSKRQGVNYSPSNPALARPLALVGMPGSGKSSLAAALARALGVDFIDGDALVEQRSGMTISDIFAQKGEKHFRKLERDVIGDLARAWSEQRIKPFVFASGGGAMAYLGSRKILLQSFTTVWLDCSLDTLARRLSVALVNKGKDSASSGARARAEGEGAKASEARTKVIVERPLLRGAESIEDIKVRLQPLLAARRDFYAASDKRLLVADRDKPSRLVARLRELVCAHSTPLTSTHLTSTPPDAPDGETTITLSLPTTLPSCSYKIVVGRGLLGKASVILQELAGAGELFIVVERKLIHYAEVLRHNLLAQGSKSVVIAIPVSETQKTLRTAERLCQRLSEYGAGRDSLVVIIGGGVLCDLGAFAASIFMRGISFALLPTTLLAQVDAAIGGKNGVNSATGKNMLGAFRQPRIVLCDTDFLTTLSARHMRCGYAEILKYALIADASFFAWLEKHGRSLLGGDLSSLLYAISHSVRIKARIVEEDEHELYARRALLNLGHTFGHALERLSHYRVAHGEAVAFGCLLAFRFALSMGVCPASDVDKLASHLRFCGLPTRLSDLPVDPAHFDRFRDCSGWISAMGYDKKRRAGGLRLVLPSAIGCCALQSPIELKALSTRLAPLLRGI